MASWREDNLFPATPYFRLSLPPQLAQVASYVPSLRRFPTGALDDPKVFYAADDDEALKRNAGRMFESVQKFIDLDTVDAHPMSEYVFED